MTERTAYMLTLLVTFIIVVVVGYCIVFDYVDHPYCNIDKHGTHWTESEYNGRQPIKCERNR